MKNNIVLHRTEPLADIVKPLLRWYRSQARDLPWRENPSPYHVWISEIMLQQTRVEAVKPYFARFTAALPDVRALAGIATDDLLKLWEGLGYYSRARNLQKAAREICQQHAGVLPADFAVLLTLPGIGRYTAGAISSIAYGQRQPAVDGNVLRIIMRLIACPEDILKESVKRAVEDELRRILPENAGDFNQALMDLGAMVCLPKGAAKCPLCPLNKICLAAAEESTADYPFKQPKKPRRIEKKTVLLITCQENILLCRRPDTGLLAGLWEFPNHAGHIAPEDVHLYLHEKGWQAHSIQKLPASKHIFSHIEWHMTAYQISLASAIQPENPPPNTAHWIRKNDVLASYAIPAAFRAYTGILLTT